MLLGGAAVFKSSQIALKGAKKIDIVVKSSNLASYRLVIQLPFIMISVKPDQIIFILNKNQQSLFPLTITMITTDTIGNVSHKQIM